MVRSPSFFGLNTVCVRVANLPCCVRCSDISGNLFDSAHDGTICGASYNFTGGFTSCAIYPIGASENLNSAQPDFSFSTDLSAIEISGPIIAFYSKSNDTVRRDSSFIIRVAALQISHALNFPTLVKSIPVIRYDSLTNVAPMQYLLSKTWADPHISSLKILFDATAAPCVLLSLHLITNAVSFFSDCILVTGKSLFR